MLNVTSSAFSGQEQGLAELQGAPLWLQTLEAPLRIKAPSALIASVLLWAGQNKCHKPIKMHSDISDSIIIDLTVYFYFRWVAKYHDYIDLLLSNTS